jgi:hypothetical protein
MRVRRAPKKSRHPPLRATISTSPVEFWAELQQQHGDSGPAWDYNAATGEPGRAGGRIGPSEVGRRRASAAGHLGFGFWPRARGVGWYSVQQGFFFRGSALAVQWEHLLDANPFAIVQRRKRLSEPPYEISKWSKQISTLILYQVHISGKAGNFSIIRVNVDWIYAILI